MSILRNMEPLNVNRMGKEIEQIERHYLNFDFFFFCVCVFTYFNFVKGSDMLLSCLCHFLLLSKDPFPFFKLFCYRINV